MKSDNSQYAICKWHHLYPNKVTLGKVHQTPTSSWKTPIPTSLLTTIVGQLRFAEEDMVHLSHCPPHQPMLFLCSLCILATSDLTHIKHVTFKPAVGADIPLHFWIFLVGFGVLVE